MSERLRTRLFARRSMLGLALLAAVTLGLVGCGSTAPAKTGSPPSAANPQPVAVTPGTPTHPRGAATRRPTAPTPRTAKTPASTRCPTGEKRTATGLCYSPAAQAKLVAKLGPCLPGQVVADNGACQPLNSSSPTNRPSLPARCRRPRRSACAPGGSLQGGPAPRSPGFDPVFH